MNRLRPQGLLLALVLTTLPASSAHAWPGDIGTPSASRGEIAIIDMQAGVPAFRHDGEACAGPSSSEPGMENISCLTVNEPGEQGSGTATLAPATAIKTAALDLSHKATSHQRAVFPKQPLIGTQPPDPDHESIDFDLFKSEQDNAPDGTQVSRGGLKVEGVNVGAAWAMFGRLAPHRQGSERSEVLAVDSGTDDYAKSEHYHWGGLLAQSLFFNVIENGFRAASDDLIRNLLANKPFWHDYAASLRQFNMRRWNDGDDFLVNYTGHPMQGAVSGFIEIQNDPRGRELRSAQTVNTGRVDSRHSYGPRFTAPIQRSVLWEKQALAMRGEDLPDPLQDSLHRTRHLQALHEQHWMGRFHCHAHGWNPMDACGRYPDPLSATASRATTAPGWCQKSYAVR